MLPYAGSERFYPTNVLMTTDAGRTWFKMTYPAQPAGVDYYVTAVACPSTARCYFTASRSRIITDLDGTYTQTDDAFVILSSRNAGRTLTLSTSPGAGSVSRLSCPDASNCAAVTSDTEPSAIWYTHDAGRTWGQFTLSGPPAQIQAIDCPTQQSCIGIASGTTFSTDDAGQYWTTARGAGTLDGVSCNTQMRCVGLQRTTQGDRPVKDF